MSGRCESNRSTASYGDQKRKSLHATKNVLVHPLPEIWQNTDWRRENENCNSILTSEFEKMPKKKHGLRIGLNTSLKLLKASKISCLLLSSEIKPKFVINCVATFAFTCFQTIKLFVLPVQLINKIITELFNVKSVALACIRSEAPEMESWLQTACSKYLITNDKVKQKFSNIILINPQKRFCINKESKNQKVSFQNLYLDKKFENSRSFEPRNALKVKEQTTNENFISSSDFISFSNRLSNESNFKGNSKESKILKKHKLKYKNSIYSNKKTKKLVTVEVMQPYNTLKIKKIQKHNLAFCKNKV